MLDSFNLELQLKNNKSANKNKLKKLLDKLRVFKVVIVLFIVLGLTIQKSNK